MRQPFNTACTTAMVQKVNALFSSGNLDWWRRPAHRKWFCGPGPLSLADIARTTSLFPPGGAGSPAGRRWLQWLKSLEIGVKPTPADRIRQCICRALRDPGCIEIVFVVVPNSIPGTTVSCSHVGTPSAYSEVITITTTF